MKKISSFVIVFLSFFGFSQNFKGEITNVKTSGLNQITIAPKVRAVATDDLRYFRILDAKSNQVPYAFATNQTQTESYSKFNIVSKTSIPDSITSLVIQNESGKKIKQFSLKIENTSLSKMYSVSGSNDSKEWFGLVANELLSDLVGSTGTSTSKTIYFPVNTYTYLRIVINDKKSLPINILSVGIEETQLIPEKLIEIPDFTYKIVEDKVKKVTKIVFSAANRYQIDAIKFDITTDYFNRSAKLLVKREERVKKRTTIYEEALSYFDVNSKNSRIIYINAVDERDFTIEIDNQDNQPLSISKIELFQKPIVIVSKLTANENYKVLIDTTYTKPSYDLESFVAETVVNLPEVAISNFDKANAKESKVSKKSFWQTKLFMWICIILGGTLVAYFAFGLIKDLKNEE